MAAVLFPLFALFSGIGILLVGNGLLGTLLSVRTVVLGYSVEVTGLVMSAYFVGFIVGSVQCVGLIERAGHVRTFAALASVASAASLAYILFVSPLAWSILRAISGFCFAGLFMVTESWLNERSDNTNRGRVLSSYTLVNLFALAMGQFFLTVPDPGGFELFCLSSILVSLGLVPIALTRTTAPAPPRAEPMGLSRLYAASPVGMVGSFASGLAIGAFWTMAPVFGGLLELSNADIATFMSATILGGLLSTWPVGRLSDRYDRRIVIALSASASGLSGVALALAAGESRLALLILAPAFGAASFPLYSLAVAHTNDFLDRGDLVAATSGLLLIYGIGAILGPMAAGVAMGMLGPGGLYYYIGAIMGCLVLFAAYRVRRRPTVPAEEKDPVVPVPRTTHVAYELDPRMEPASADDAAGPAVADAGSGLQSDPTAR